MRELNQVIDQAKQALDDLHEQVAAHEAAVEAGDYEGADYRLALARETRDDLRAALDELEEEADYKIGAGERPARMSPVEQEQAWEGHLAAMGVA